MAHPKVIAKCPYYEKENQITIFCESNVRVREEGKKGYQAHLFKNASDKTEYMKNHCQKYPKAECPYANYMDRFYEKIERGKRNANKSEDETGKTAAGKSGKNHCRVRKGKSVSVRLM